LNILTRAPLVYWFLRFAGFLFMLFFYRCRLKRLLSTLRRSVMWQCGSQIMVMIVTIVLVILGLIQLQVSQHKF
jgi:hypothetical protein